MEFQISIGSNFILLSEASIKAVKMMEPSSYMELAPDKISPTNTAEMNSTKKGQGVQGAATKGVEGLRKSSTSVSTTFFKYNQVCLTSTFQASVNNRWRRAITERQLQHPVAHQERIWGSFPIWELPEEWN